MKYKILAALLVVVYFMQTFFISFGGIGADSLSYFGIAADLPHAETNLFPLGYPILLKLMHTLLHDYFWASKILNLLFTVILLGFSYYRKFYFRETVLLFAGKTFYFTFFGAMSEGPFIFFMYFLIYFLHQIFSERKHLYLNSLLASLMLILMFTSRYSGIYIYASAVLFCVLMIPRIKHQYYFSALWLFVLISGTGIGGYLLFNSTHFGSLTGENLRGGPSDHSFIQLIRNFLGLFNAVDPYIGIKPMSNSLGSMAFQCFVFITDIFILQYLVRYYRMAKETPLYYFHIFLWITAGVYGISVMASGWFQQIEEMGTRLMAASNFCLFFSFLILYFQKNTSDKIIWRTGCFFFVFLVLYGLKDPGNYLKNKSAIEPQMTAFKNKKYLYNNEKNLITVTTYYLPVVKKSFHYTHTNKQKGKLKESIAGTINPGIKWIKEDTVRDRSKVLYTSQLHLDQ